MLEIVKAVFFVTVAVTLGIAILAYASLFFFYPLLKTVQGGFRLAGARAREEKGLVGAELGLTLADGGERVQEKERK